MSKGIFLKNRGLSDCTGIRFAVSKPLSVCANRRIHQHKIFKRIALRGRCPLVWFYGFNLHISTNDKDGIIDGMITSGKLNGRKPLQYKNFIKKLYGKPFVDKGDLFKELFPNLFFDGILLATNLKTKRLTSMFDAYMLRKRAVLKTIFDRFKNTCHLEQPKRRSLANYFNIIFSALLAYNFIVRKISLKNNFTKQLYLF